MGADGDLYCGTCGRPIQDDPLHCSACGAEISAAETMASHREHGRYLCLECMGAEEPV
ncbi:MAG TPA: hypothetical protein PLY91_07710 [Methanoregulaceae archaeon]|nr:hypothetical protein [Methanoregulaceae archaeon]